MRRSLAISSSMVASPTRPGFLWEHLGNQPLLHLFAISNA
jgi:hypothetical protein